MNIFTFITLGIVISGVLAVGSLDINTEACDVYTGKFGTAQSNGTGATKLSMSGVVSFTTGTADAVVKISYSDDKYFNDEKFFGLVTEDGQKSENTCLTLKLFKYTSDKYTDPVEVLDLPIVNEKNEATRWRAYVLNFKGSEMKARLIETETPTTYVYTGYYGLAYYLQGTIQVQYTHKFSFALTVNRASSSVVDTAFYPISSQGDNICLNCEVKPSTSLEFCTDSSCKTTTLTKTIYLNEGFWLLHKITTSGLQNYKLSDSEVRFVAPGLNKKAQWQTGLTPTYSAGQAIYPIKASIAWDSLKLQAATKLVNGRRILAESQSSLRVLVDEVPVDSVTGSSEAVGCVKNSGTDTCVTCDEMCEQNCGLAPTGCTCTQKLDYECDSADSASSIMATLTFIILLVLF